jgi:hypothetical protein
MILRNIAPKMAGMRTAFIMRVKSKCVTAQRDEYDLTAG